VPLAAVQPSARIRPIQESESPFCYLLGRPRPAFRRINQEQEITIVKGVVFTEFLEMVDAKYSPAMVEEIIEAADLPSGGAYTAVGTYSHRELLVLLRVLATKTGEKPAAILKSFGEPLLQSFLRTHQKLYGSVTNAFDLFAHAENYIHREVKKLYPDAIPPHFDIECHTPQRFTMVYRSPRPFADLCEGLIHAVLRHYGETAEVRRTDLETAPFTCVRFDIVKSGQ
jgi:hypothetical protein